MKRDLTTGAIGTHVANLAPFAVMGFAVHVAFEVIDAWWLGRVGDGKAALTALSVSTYVVWSLYGIGHMVEAGGLALVSQAVGAKEPERAKRMATRALVAAGLFWVLTVLFYLPAGAWIVRLTGIHGEPGRMAEGYLEVVLFGAVTIFGNSALSAVFRSWGDTRTPLILLSGALALNALLDPILIFGWWGGPELGLEGAAWATVITRGSMFVVGTMILIKRGFLAPLNQQILKRWRPLLRLVRIGFPCGLAGILYCVTFFFMTAELAKSGNDAVAAFVVGQKSESISWGILIGLGTVAGSIVGQNIGAGQLERARRGLSIVLQVGILLGFGCAALFYFFGGGLVQFFAPGSPEIVDLGTQYLTIIAFSQVFLALEIVLDEGLSGSGDTVPPLIIVGSFTLMRVPLALILAGPFGLGVLGVFWAVTISTVVKGILMWFWFARGTWVGRGLIMTRSSADLD